MWASAASALDRLAPRLLATSTTMLRSRFCPALPSLYLFFQVRRLRFENRTCACNGLV